MHLTCIYSHYDKLFGTNLGQTFHAQQQQTGPTGTRADVSTRVFYNVSCILWNGYGLSGNITGRIFKIMTLSYIPSRGFL